MDDGDELRSVESETRSAEDVTGKPHAPCKSPCQRRTKAEKIEWSHSLQVSPATTHHEEAVFSNVTVIYGRERDDPMNDLDLNMAIWSIFLNATLRAPVHTYWTSL